MNEKSMILELHPTPHGPLEEPYWSVVNAVLRSNSSINCHLPSTLKEDLSYAIDRERMNISRQSYKHYRPHRWMSQNLALFSC